MKFIKKFCTIFRNLSPNFNVQFKFLKNIIQSELESNESNNTISILIIKLKLQKQTSNNGLECVTNKSCRSWGLKPF